MFWVASRYIHRAHCFLDSPCGERGLSLCHKFFFKDMFAVKGRDRRFFGWCLLCLGVFRRLGGNETQCKVMVSHGFKEVFYDRTNGNRCKGSGGDIQEA